jgi:hypothetical protein
VMFYRVALLEISDPSKSVSSTQRAKLRDIVTYNQV